MFKKGDNVVLILKPNGNLEMKKEKTNFWDEVPKMSAQEKRLQIEDLGCSKIPVKYIHFIFFEHIFLSYLRLLISAFNLFSTLPNFC